MGLPNKMAKLGDAAIAAAKELAGFSGAMGEAAIEQAFGDLRRSIQKAQQTGQSTLSLTRRTEELKDSFLPIQNAITNVTNYLLEMGVELVIAMLPLVQGLFEVLKKLLIWTLKLVSYAVDFIEWWWGQDGLGEIIRKQADKIAQVEINTRKEDSRGPLEDLLQDIAAGGLIR